MKVKLSFQMRTEDHHWITSAPKGPFLDTIKFFISAETSSSDKELFTALTAANIPFELGASKNEFMLPNDKSINIQKICRNPMALGASNRSYSYMDLEALDRSFIFFQDFQWLWEHFNKDSSGPVETINKLIDAVVYHRSPYNLLLVLTGKIGSNPAVGFSSRFDQQLPRDAHSMARGLSGGSAPSPRCGK